MFPKQSRPDLPPSFAAIANGRDTIPTHEAAVVLNRKPNTMRRWACMGTGPIRPIHINGRLAWRVSDLAALLCGEVA